MSIKSIVCVFDGNADETNAFRSALIDCERVAHGIGHILLEKATDLKSDVLVMGVYGHCHIEKMLLGGVSNHLLKHSRVPLLLTH